MRGLAAGEVEEASEVLGDRGSSVVYEDIHEAGFSGLGEDIIIGDGCGYQGAITLLQEYLFACIAYTDLAVTLHAYGDDETVVFAKIAMKRF